MKLIGKLTLTSTLSKVTIMLLFIAVLPFLVDSVVWRSTNRLLKKQEQKVFENIRLNGMEYYLEKDSSYGSYTLLKEEYISLELTDRLTRVDTIATEQRIIEGDTMMYRILHRNFEYNNNLYALEIGKSVSSISQYNAPLQRIALLVLGGLILFTLITDLFFTKILLRPLNTIMRTKVRDAVFPFKKVPEKVRTSTSDFKNLDQLLIDLMHRINDDFNREREFTSNASHELMTPIGILQTKMENLLLVEDIRPEMQEKLIGMMKTLQRLKKIVHSLLLIARIENDQYSLKDTVKITDLVDDILEELQPAIEGKSIHVSISLSGVVLNNINKDLLRQLLYNLMHNAIRYNRQDGTLKISDNTDENGIYTLYISDTGVGMSVDDIEGLFARFRKKNTDAEGYGLGLSIGKAIADYHKMNIQVNSKEGEGTTFIIRFNSR